jgi:hypothetical protein
MGKTSGEGFDKAKGIQGKRTQSLANEGRLAMLSQARNSGESGKDF